MKSIYKILIVGAILAVGAVGYLNRSPSELAGAVFLPYQGGTGTGTAPTSGQVLIGTSTGVYTPAFITAGSNITLTTGSGTLKIDATGGGSTFTGIGISNGSAFSHITSLSFDAGMFSLSNVASLSTVRLNWTTGPASRSANQTISGAWTFNNNHFLTNASVSANLEITGVASASRFIGVGTGSSSFSGGLEVSKGVHATGAVSVGDNLRVTGTSFLGATFHSALANFGAASLSTNFEALGYASIGNPSASNSFKGSLNISKGLRANSFQGGGLANCSSGQAANWSAGQFNCTNLNLIFQPLSPHLTAFNGIDLTTGFISQVVADPVGATDFQKRTFTSEANQITITNGDGVSANPYFTLNWGVNGVASRSATNTWTAFNKFTGGASISNILEVYGTGALGGVASISRQLNVGGFTVLAGAVVQIASSANNFVQLNVQNFSSGASASTDIVATANDGNNSGRYVDLGINSSTFKWANQNTLTAPHDAYLIASQSGLDIWDASASGFIKFAVGNATNSSNLRFTLTSAGASLSVPIEVSAYASVSQLYGAALSACTGSQFLQWSAGLFSCGTPSGGGSAAPITIKSWPNGTRLQGRTSISFEFNSFVVTASGTKDATIKLNWTNGPASKSSANTWTGVNKFNLGASFSPNLEVYSTGAGIGGIASIQRQFNLGGLAQPAGSVFQVASASTILTLKSTTTPQSTSSVAIDFLPNNGNSQSKFTLKAGGASALASESLSVINANGTLWSISSAGYENLQTTSGGKAQGIRFNNGTTGIGNFQALDLSGTSYIFFSTNRTYDGNGWKLLNSRAGADIQLSADNIIAFLTFPANSTTGTEWMRIMSTGHVGIGTTAPGFDLTVASTGAGVLLSLTGSAGTCNHTPGAASETVACSSDRKLKTNITDLNLTGALNTIMKYHLRDYTIKSTGQEAVGVIAQELQATLPNEVKTAPDGTLMVNQPSPWLLLAGEQELNLRVTALEKGKVVGSLGSVSLESQINALSFWQLLKLLLLKVVHNP